MMKTKTGIVLTAAASIMCGWSALTFAASHTISAVVPWQGQGQIFPVSTGGLRFLGSIEGIMYVETAEGDMNEALVRCPIVQDINVADGSTSVSGSCMIIVSPEDVVFADVSCRGITGMCRGEMTLTNGTGRFAGISGSGNLTVRSPIHTLVADLSDGTVVHAAAGILLLPQMQYSLP